MSTRIFSYPKLLQTSSLRIRSPLRRGLGRRRERQYVLRTSRPATLAQQVRGAEGGSTRVVLLQLCLGIRAPTQGIFQYNNVLGSPMFAFSRHNYYVQKKLRSTRTPEEQHASPDRGQYGCTPVLLRRLQEICRIEKGSNVSRLLKPEPSATNVLRDTKR